MNLGYKYKFRSPLWISQILANRTTYIHLCDSYVYGIHRKISVAFPPVLALLSSYFSKSDRKKHLQSCMSLDILYEIIH